MEQRALGNTGRDVSVVGLGTWQLGADWGSVDESAALAVLDSAVDSGVTFFDTADVYGDGRSEQLIGRFRKSNPDISLTVATKMGRRLPKQDPAAYTLESFREWNDRSRRNLGVDTLDLVQLHCPPTAVYSTDAVFDALDTLVGETFSGVDYDTGIEAAQEFSALAPDGASPAQLALRWVIQQPGVTTVIPGARDADQARANAAAADVPALTNVTLQAIADIYDRRIRATVHNHW